jgi:hypothetical protein
MYCTVHTMTVLSIPKNILLLKREIVKQIAPKLSQSYHVFLFHDNVLFTHMATLAIATG